MDIDMPFIQNEQEVAFLLRENNIKIKIKKEMPNHHKETTG